MARISNWRALSFVMLAVASSSGCARDTKSSGQDLERLRVLGSEVRNGMFDPSVEYGSEGIGWMAYSSVEVPEFVETHIAKSTDRGKTWRFVGKPNSSLRFLHTMESGETVDAVWRYETPSLLYDPADVAERRWKLFTNRYPVLKPFSPTDRRMSEGTIEVQYAASPDGSWSTPVCVMGALAGCRLRLAGADPALVKVTFMTEISTIVRDGVTYMSMDVGSTESGLGDWEHYKIILLASADHGENWRYVGTLLDHGDAMRFKYRVFTGSSLVQEQGRAYLMATPSGATNKSRTDHDGTMVMELADIGRAMVARDPDGAPIVIKRIDVEKQSGGLADYDEQNTSGGIVFSQVSLWGMPEIFQLWSTGQSIALER